MLSVIDDSARVATGARATVDRKGTGRRLRRQYRPENTVKEDGYVESGDPFLKGHGCIRSPYRRHGAQSWPLSVSGRKPARRHADSHGVRHGGGWLPPFFPIVGDVVFFPAVPINGEIFQAKESSYVLLRLYP